MKKSVMVLGIIIFCFALILGTTFWFSVKYTIGPEKSFDPKYLQSLQDHYEVRVGSNIFKIPVEYLLDDRVRENGQQVDPLRETLIGPLIFFSPPDLSPVDNARTYKRYPYGLEGTVRFFINPILRKSKARIMESFFNGIKNDELADVTLPDFKKVSGLHSIGYKQRSYVSDKTYDFFLFINNHKPIAHIRCGNEKSDPIPGCSAYMEYLPDAHLNFSFRREYLEWFGEEGFIKTINFTRSLAHRWWKS